MQRIEEFLNESEVPEWASSLTMSYDDGRTYEIGFAAATFQWPSLPKSPSTPSCFELGPLDITFPKGKLTLVSGATGSGKSALLAALLGGQSPIFFLPGLLSTEILEMHCTSGEVFINKSHHKVAYCGQTPCMCFCVQKVPLINYSTCRVGTCNNPG
jgi:ABC-type uncharacterized transport system fused permease/ATPase subunit